MPEFCQNSPKFAGIQNPDASGRIRTHPDASGIGTSSAESSAFGPSTYTLEVSAGKPQLAACLAGRKCVRRPLSATLPASSCASSTDGGFVKRSTRSTGSCQCLANFRQNVARFRLYRHRFLQENTRFAAFFKI